VDTDLFTLYRELLKFSGFYSMQEHLGDLKEYTNKDESNRRLVVSIWFLFFTEMEPVLLQK